MKPVLQKEELLLGNKKDAAKFTPNATRRLIHR